MEKISRYIFWGLAIGIAMALLASCVQAGGSPIENVSIESGKVYYDGISYEAAIILENMGNENVTASFRVEVDQIEIVNTEVTLTIAYFKGFRIKTHKSVYFEVPTEAGYHEGMAAVSSGDITIIQTFIYKAYGHTEEEVEEEEEVEDWLGCP